MVPPSTAPSTDGSPSSGEVKGRLAATPRTQWPSHKKALLIVLAVLALVGGATVIVLGEMHTAAAARQLAADREGARLAGQHYLEALAAGDAATAVSLAAQPPSDNRFLTDQILRAQLATLPITDIAVANAPGGAGGAEPVLLSARFGTILSQTTLQARKVDGQWKLDTATVPVRIGTDPDAKDLRIVALSGVHTVGATSVDVFPGILQVSTTNQYVDLTADVKPALLEALTDPAQRPVIVPAVALNDAGRDAALAAVERFQKSCYTGERPSYRCCPTGNCAPPPEENHGIDRNTVRIIGRENIGEMTYSLDPATMHVAVSGVIRYDGEARVYGTVQPLTFDLHSRNNLVDLSRSPPEEVS
ncbi:hypothetical protein [Mycolicibacterium komossense]|uniref:DUF4878 domain-containing protein n=1 Tax=Mycolicibacterium komossense TaxID=1779 RepID=A0ABT3CHU1_9MYCO|nr:hypothetical protein [Mycolicibacterium komossense]MCV7228796.1 hypothetical protein [Mycolicibacterium komossense]